LGVLFYSQSLPRKTSGRIHERENATLRNPWGFIEFVGGGKGEEIPWFPFADTNKEKSKILKESGRMGKKTGAERRVEWPVNLV